MTHWSLWFGLGAVGAAGSMCAEESLTTDVLQNSSIPACDQFNRIGPAITLPADSATVLHGVLQKGFGGMGVQLRDRHDALHDLSGSLVQTFLDSFIRDSPDDRAQLLTKVVFSEPTRAATSVEEVLPVIFVRKSTVTKIFQNTFFYGHISNRHPPSDVNTNDGLALQFGSTVTDSKLPGTRLSSLGEYSESAERWYADKLGLEGNVSLVWFPGMHGPGDSRLVLEFQKGPPGYMSKIATAPEFLNRTTSEVLRKDPEWRFSVHGNPMNTVDFIQGTFSTTPLNTTTTTQGTVPTTPLNTTTQGTSSSTTGGPGTASGCRSTPCVASCASALVLALVALRLG